MGTKCPVCFSSIVFGSKKNKITQSKCRNCKASFYLPATENINLLTNDFILLQKVGEGSTSFVYKAWQLSLNRYVALKIFKGSFSSLENMCQFLYEARVIARLTHLNIVKCYSVGEYNGIYYIAMEFIEGRSLRSFIDYYGGKLETNKIIEIIFQLLEALCYIWQSERLIHRDIKPENLMITKNGVIKLIDLGSVIKQTDWASYMGAVGTPRYMNPGIYRGDVLDFSSDVYNIGIMFYEMLFGKLPNNAAKMVDIEETRIKMDLIPINTILPDVSKNISNLLGRMLQLKGTRPLSSLEELKYEIGMLCNEVLKKG